MPHYWHNDNIYYMCIVFLIYTQNLHYKYKVKIKEAHHSGQRLLNGIKNDVILKFSLIDFGGNLAYFASSVVFKVPCQFLV